MLAVTSYPALDVFIGLAFLYFLLSIVCSSINEGIATLFALRAQTLEEGIRKLLGGDDALVEKFYNDARVQALTQSKWWFGLRKNKKPSYIPSRIFALALLDTVAGLCTTACALVKEFADIKLCWVPREMNSEADALASRALGRGHARGVPEAAADGER